MRSEWAVFAALALAAPAAAQQPRPENGDPRALFSADDYPAAALQRKDQGTVRAELTIGTDGRVKACRIVRSSKSAELDSATCNLLTRRARFTPARDSRGNPVEDTYLAPPIAWVIEEAPAGPAMQQTQPGRYLCNGAAGAVGEQPIVPLRAGKDMRLAVRLLKADPEPKQPVVAAVFLGTARVAVRKEQAHFYASVTIPSRNEQIVYQYPLTRDWIILTLSLDPRGDLVVRGNKDSPRFPLGTAQLSGTTLHCASGDWEFDIWPRSYAPPAAVQP